MSIFKRALSVFALSALFASPIFAAERLSGDFPGSIWQELWGSLVAIFSADETEVVGVYIPSGNTGPEVVGAYIPSGSTWEPGSDQSTTGSNAATPSGDDQPEVVGAYIPSG